MGLVQGHWSKLLAPGLKEALGHAVRLGEELKLTRYDACDSDRTYFRLEGKRGTVEMSVNREDLADAYVLHPLMDFIVRQLKEKYLALPAEPDPFSLVEFEGALIPRCMIDEIKKDMLLEKQLEYHEMYCMTKEETVTFDDMYAAYEKGKAEQEKYWKQQYYGDFSPAQPQEPSEYKKKKSLPPKDPHHFDHPFKKFFF